MFATDDFFFFFFLTPPIGIQSSVVPHCASGGAGRALSHAAEFPALSRGLPFGKGVSCVLTAHFPLVWPLYWFSHFRLFWLKLLQSCIDVFSQNSGLGTTLSLMMCEALKCRAIALELANFIRF